MIKCLFHQFVGLKNYFIISRLYNIHKKCDDLSKKHSWNIKDFDIKIKNPVLAILLETYQRYGYVKVASSSKLISPELKLIIESFKDYPINFEDVPKYLSNCRSNEDVIKLLTNIYSKDIGIEYLHLNSMDEINWISDKFSKINEIYQIDSNMKIEYMKLLNRAEHFDLFLAKKFQSVKRYSGEGAESFIICMLEIFKSASKFKISNIVISMAHRCRNNLLTTLLNYPPVLYFRKMLGLSEFPKDIKFATGDTFSHYFYSMDFLHDNGFPVHISLIPNPSHLEANIPVGAGKIRSKMQYHLEGDYSVDKNSSNGDNVLGVFVHGDASVYGQGIVTESLIMTDSLNFTIGGGIHIVINNSLGFTTETPSGVKNVTDVGKIVNCPIIHVNAYNISNVAKVAMLAMDYRFKFRRDIFINLICYRRWGHNELDDPTITQPIMYSKITSAKSITEEFLNVLIQEKCIESKENINDDLQNWLETLNENLKIANDYKPQLFTFKDQWSNQNILDTDLKLIGIYDTGFCVDKLKEIGQCSVHIPVNFNIHQNIYRAHIQKRLQNLNTPESGHIDWATAEALAIGSLMSEGTNCRISGQDVGRGTFSHRHFVFVDQKTNEQCIPFNVCPWPPMFEKRGYLEVANSILSEEAVLGFEIGMAMDNPNNLFIWEAQFGDFFNGAQVIVDTYLGSAETKWMLQNGLVLLLPHGYDGAGPEHSSCRLERFLQLTDSSESECDSDFVNMHIINPTTPAQYFHGLRRQIVRPFKRPLIVISPKLLLRSILAVSNISDFKNGTYFHNILSHTDIYITDTVKTVLLCSGKHYYSMKNYLETSIMPEKHNKFAIIRLEQLAPFPATELKKELEKFKNATKFVWCQEEARNMGAWQFVNSRIRNVLGINLQYAGRKELATPAVGITDIHKNELSNILHDAFN